MMLNNFPDTFTLVQIHLDTYSTAWGNARASFYGVGGIPDAWFDGVQRVLGAGSIQSAYQNYLAKYNLRRAVQTDVTLMVGGEPVSGQTYKASARVCLATTGTAKTVRIYMVQVLDFWPASPNYHRNCFVQAATTQDVALQPGQCQTVERNFTFTDTTYFPSWTNRDDIKIIVWAQQISGGKEVYQAAQMRWPFAPLYPTGDLNCDNVLNAFDIDPFVLAMTSPTGYQAAYPNCNRMLADCNHDGFVDAFDIDVFVNLLTP